MKLSTLLILLCVGAVLFAAFGNDKIVALIPGTSKLLSRSPASPSPSSSWPQSAAAPARWSPSTPAPSSPGIVDSALAFVKHVAAKARLPSLAPHRTSWALTELRIVRGNVVESFQGGLVVESHPWIVRSANGYLYAGDGLGMNPIFANRVDNHELFQFGHLMEVKHGELRQSHYDRAMWGLTSYAEGMVLLQDYPDSSLSPGKSLKVVAAPDSGVTWRGQSISIYTANVVLDGDPSAVKNP